MDLQGIVDLRSATGSLISMYVDRTAGPSSTVVNELVKVLKARAEVADRAASMSIRADIDRIEAAAKQFDGGGDPAWVVFASEIDDIFVHHPLGKVDRSEATVGRRPYLRPLRALRRPIESLLMVVERSRVVLYRADGALAELGRFEAEVGKDNFGGFQGYEEHNVSRHAAEESGRIWKEAAAAALTAHQARPVDLVVAAGHRHDLVQFTSHFHPYLAALPVELMVVDTHTASPAELVDRIKAIEPTVNRSRDEEAIRAVLEGAYEGKPVARGSAAVLAATNLGAVDRLVVSGPFAKAGVRCDDCGWLARSGDRCPTCDSALAEVDDVVGAAVESVLGQGGRFDQVALASALDADGVAAVLRFPIPS